jgi:hypothetical protein
VDKAAILMLPDVFDRSVRLSGQEPMYEVSKTLEMALSPSELSLPTRLTSHPV